MQILLVHDEDIKSDVISLAIEGYFEGAVVLAVSNPSEARARLAKAGKIDLIVSSGLFANGENAGQLFPTSTPMVLILEQDSDLPAVFRSELPAAILKSPIEIKALVKAIERLGLGDAAETASGYCPVSIHTLLITRDKFSVDLFIKLSETKFVKATNVHDEFGQEEFDKFRAKNIEFLYVRRADFLDLVDRWMKTIESITNAPAGEVSFERNAEVFRSVHMTVHASLGVQGFTPELRRLTEASIKMAISTFKSVPKLSHLLDKLKGETAPYISAHSTSLAYVACQLASLMDWKSDTTFHKLVLSAYLHDITLIKDEWAELQTKQEIMSDKTLTEINRHHILNHPRKAAELVKDLEEVPGEVSFIVEQHHELPDGEGFPAGITVKDISPVSALFIIAHDVVTEMTRFGKSFDFGEYLKGREESKQFSRGSLGTVFRTIREKN